MVFKTRAVAIIIIIASIGFFSPENTSKPRQWKGLTTMIRYCSCIGLNTTSAQKWEIRHVCVFSIFIVLLMNFFYHGAK